MRGVLLGLLLLSGCSAATTTSQALAPAPPAAPAHDDTSSRQVWHGSIRCGILEGFSTVPLNQPVTLEVNGTEASLDRAVRFADTRVETDVRERASGTVAADGSLTLSGRASSRGYSYTSQYSGMLRPDGKASRLAGAQKWSGSRIRSTDRQCAITLRRES